jgi:hypothetical protein
MSKYTNTLVNLIEHLKENNIKNHGCTMHMVSLPRNIKMSDHCGSIDCNSCIFDIANTELLPETIKHEQVTK